MSLFTHLFPSRLVCDLLILSIYLIFPFFISISRRRFSLFTHRPMFHLAPATSRLYIYSPFIYFVRAALLLTNPFSSFSLPSTLSVCPQQICTLFYLHLRRVERFMPLLSHRCRCLSRISISVSKGCNPSFGWICKNVLQIFLM